MRKNLSKSERDDKANCFSHIHGFTNRLENNLHGVSLSIIPVHEKEALSLRPVPTIVTQSDREITELINGCTRESSCSSVYGRAQSLVCFLSACKVLVLKCASLDYHAHHNTIAGNN